MIFFFKFIKPCQTNPQTSKETKFYKAKEFNPIIKLQTTCALISLWFFHTIINTNVCYVSKKCIDKFVLKDQIHTKNKTIFL